MHSFSLSSMIYARDMQKVLSLIAVCMLLAGALVGPATGDEPVAGDEEEQRSSIQEAEPGALLLPAGATTGNTTEKTEKQCMTVCSHWGESCTLINRGIGGTSQKCRRTCKQFSEECF